MSIIQKVVEWGTFSPRRPFKLFSFDCRRAWFSEHLFPSCKSYKEVQVIHREVVIMSLFSEMKLPLILLPTSRSNRRSVVTLLSFPFQNVASMLLLLMEDPFSQSSNNFSIFLVLCKEGNLCNLLFYLPAISVSCRNPSCSAHNTVLKTGRNPGSSLENHLVTVWIVLWVLSGVCFK